jgi:hypothetical protein
MHQLKTPIALDTIAVTIAYCYCGKDCGIDARWSSAPQTIACHYKCQVSSVEDYPLLTDIPFFYGKITSGNLQKNIKRYKAYKGIKILVV